jgi:hypothetical protein
MTTASVEKPVPEWIRLYKFFFKYAPSDQDSETWAKEIRSAVHNLRPGEVSQAIRSLGERYAAMTKKVEPSGSEIIQEIRRTRREDRGNIVATPNRVDFYLRGELRTTSMIDLKKTLEDRPEPEECWSIICTPMDVDQCRELQAYCDHRQINYRRFHPPSAIDVRGLAGQMTAEAF